MRTITIKVKYDVGDKVWIMKDNYPTRTKIYRVSISGGSEDRDNGATSNFGQVRYTLETDHYKEYLEDSLCDTFEQLRDEVFCKEFKDQ